MDRNRSPHTGKLAANAYPVPSATPRGRRTLIIGAGERADQVLREARQAEKCPVYPVGLIDLNGSHQGRVIRGVRVVGTLKDLPLVCARLNAELAIIALEPEEFSSMRRVVDQCI